MIPGIIKVEVKESVISRAKISQKPKLIIVLLHIVLKKIGSLRNDDDDGNENGKKAIGLDKHYKNFARASRFFVHFSSVVARLQRETA